VQQALSFSVRHSSTCSVSEHTSLIGGNSTEKAFASFISLSEFAKGRAHSVETQNEVLFNSERKFGCVQLSIDTKTLPRGEFFQHSTVTVAKGAPEVILSRCTSMLGEDGSVVPCKNWNSLDAALSNLSSQSFRLVCIAFSSEPITRDQQLPKLTLIGFLALQDRLRPESADAVRRCKRAGVHVVMLTGDRLETALAVAQRLRIVDHDHPETLTSSALSSMSDAQLVSLLPRLAVLARATPSDKSRLVRAAQSIGHIAGMTGDGVNDVVALKLADVGFAVGSGSEISREAADIVILDDNFASINSAILYGRTIFKSIRRFIVFQSTVNVASLLIVFLGPFLGFDFPLTLTQLLWVNVVMDTLAALAFGGELANEAVMEEAPVKRDSPIINVQMLMTIIGNGAYIAVVSIAFLTADSIAERFTRNGGFDENAFLTGFFCFFIFISNMNAFNVRASGGSLFEGLRANSSFTAVVCFIFVVQFAFTFIGGRVLRTVPLTASEWRFVVLLALSILPFNAVRRIAETHWLARDHRASPSSIV
jgi:Ca2+-transporting ATPase